MGWHNKTPLEELGLVASELGEAEAEAGDDPILRSKLLGVLRPLKAAMNAVRTVPFTANFGEECADVILRTLNIMVENDIVPSEALLAKIEKNELRGNKGRIK